MPIQLPRKSLTDFVKLYKEEFGIDLREEQAKEELSDLLYIYAFSEGKNHVLNAISSLQIKNRE